MKKLSLYLLLILFASCGKAIKKIFGSKTPHEAYAEVLDNKDLDRTPEGRAWLAAAAKALTQPQVISLPYKQSGYFAPDRPRALGLQFNAKSGQRLTFVLSKKGDRPLTLFADVYATTGNGTNHLLAADTAQNEFYFDVPENGSYTLRLQPQLRQNGSYQLSVAVGPSLLFPVSGTKAKAGSFWGDSRDGGVRRHEGIDIFAPKLTPVLAGADGVVTSVQEGGLGGKVVWQKVQGRSISLYYAHLDKQLVQPGQTVKAGDTLGLVGNTGNAKNTPAHLHFGVYGYNGPVDPWPYVNQQVRKGATPPERNLNAYLETTKVIKTAGGANLPAQTLLTPLAVNEEGFIAEAPDGTLVFTAFNGVKPYKSGKNVAGNGATGAGSSGANQQKTF